MVLGGCSRERRNIHFWMQRDFIKKVKSLKDGERGERNLRDAFQKFEEASGSDHTETTKELAEHYLYERGWEKDVIKAAELGDSNLKIILGRKWRRKGE